MAGYIHITRLSVKTGTYDRTIPEYQVNYVKTGITYAIAFDEDELVEFLRHKVPLDDQEFEAVMTRLQETGHANIGDVDIPEQEASAMGMEMIPDDF